MDGSKFTPKEVEVRDLETGEEVYRPDVAETLLGIIRGAIEKVGGTVETPDNVIDLFKKR